MNTESRSFEVKQAVRESVPLLMGLFGASGSGKTYSALRLATGIQKVTGGDVFGIDTEARRMLHYADTFRFKHLQFDAPFRSLDYLAAIRHCASQGAKVIIIDSMSHEHESVGGMLDYHDKEFERLGGREAINMLAWKRPKADRRELLNGILQIPASFIFCFRAKEKVKMVKDDKGKQQVVPQGWMPICGDEFAFEMTANCLLLPRANGVPTWASDEPGERVMMKLPIQFQTILSEPQPLSETIGEQLAQWAAGGAQAAPTKPATVEDHSTLLLAAREQAKGGRVLMEGWWKTLKKDQRIALKDYTTDLKAIAEEADAKRTGILDPTPSTGGEAASSAGSTIPMTAEGDVI